MRLGSFRGLAATACALALLSGCATGSLATSESTPPSAATISPSATEATGPTLIVTVPDLVPAVESSAAPSAAVAPPQSTSVPTNAATEANTDASATQVETPAEAEPVAPSAAAPQPEPEPQDQTLPEPAAPAGEGLNVSLENCDGCTVLATHRDVTGELSAALVGTGSGRAILLTVSADGQVSGVIGVPFGAAFSAPSGGVLACAQGRCVVQGRQGDGRAILSAYELTSSGAWRDVSGDDAFPSATERATVIDLGGELGIAVQDQGNGAAVWMLYSWDGDRYAVIGCAVDGAAPTSADAVSPDVCLS